MAIIVPSILESTAEGFSNTCSRVTRVAGVERIHIDFCDGIFVPNTTIKVGDIDILNPAYTWEAHLMLSEPTEFFDYSMLGFKVVIVHCEAYKTVESLLTAVRAIKQQGLKPGVAIKPGTDVSVLRKVDETEFFQVMGVEPGFQGAVMVDSTPSRVATLRNTIPHAIIEVDGGVKLINVKQLSNSGADLLNVGSG